MELLNFVNGNKNWRDTLQKPPYSLTIKEDGPYVLLKYNQYASDFNSPIVREARGCILRPAANGEWICVARALDKFGNYGESYAATERMHWDIGVEVQEKIDGSLIKIWYDEGRWHISTNGTIDAFKVMTQANRLNFGELFVRTYTNKAASTLADFQHFILKWDKNLCYWFELVAPEDNPVVVRYGCDMVYFLGARNMKTGNEISFSNHCANSLPEMPPHIRIPHSYPFKSLAECVKKAHELGDNEEGYVCVSRVVENGSLLRIKVKGTQYLKLHALRGNGVITMGRLIQCDRDEALDDLVAYFPFAHKVVEQYIDARELLKKRVQKIWNFILNRRDLWARKDIALYLKTQPSYYSGCIFALLDGKVENVDEWVKGLNEQKLAKILEDIINEGNS